MNPGLWPDTAASAMADHGGLRGVGPLDVVDLGLPLAVVGVVVVVVVVGEDDAGRRPRRRRGDHDQLFLWHASLEEKIPQQTIFFLFHMQQ